MVSHCFSPRPSGATVFQQRFGPVSNPSFLNDQNAAAIMACHRNLSNPTALTWRLHLLRSWSLDSQHTPHRKKGGWDEPAECPSKSHHCCRCWGGTSATECGKRARKREVMALLGWAKVIREWLPTMRGVWSSWKKTDCNYEDSPYHFWMTFGEFRCLVLRRVAVYNLKIRIATTLSSIHQLTTSLQMHCRKDFAVWNSEKMSFREDRVVPICSISS